MRKISKLKSKRKLYWEHEPDELALSAIDHNDDTRYKKAESRKHKKS